MACHTRLGFVLDHNRQDTITAQATPPGRGGIAIVRISGPQVKEMILPLLKTTTLRKRQARFTPFYNAEGDKIDQGIALFFPKPHSFTGEDVLELQGHGSPIVVDLLLAHIIQLGARLARPGEFSERAFLNGKLDLLQAEAIADLIHASSAQAARLAMRSLQGDFSTDIHALNNAVTHLRIYVEAAIDFADEEIDHLNHDQWTRQINTIHEQFALLQHKAKQGSLLREGITLVITGQPNVGKSSLLNYLSGRDVAIVTPIAGTTRDVLHEHLSMDGLPIHLIDTAGLHHTHDLIEQEGIRRAQAEIKTADIVLFMYDATNNVWPIELHDPHRTIFIRNKIDLTAEQPSIITQEDKTVVNLSVKTGEGIDLLKQVIRARMGIQQTTEGIFSARRRHLEALDQARSYFDQACHQLALTRYELVAEDLRQMQLALSRITGEFTADDLLGHIFSSFCIGK
jgi:tRNA modification GTPase